MLVKRIYDAYDFKKAMQAAGRDYYSHEAYKAMLELFDDCCEPVEFDAVAICCDFNEESLDYILSAYDNIFDPEQLRDEDGDYDMDYIMDTLNYYTMATETENGMILYQAF